MNITLNEPELGKITEVVSNLDSAATKKEFRKNELALKGFLNSVQGMRNLPQLSSKHHIAFISRTSFFNLGCIQYNFCWELKKEKIDASN